MDSPSYEFSPNSSNTTLRKHLARQHKDEYITTCSSNGWKNQLPVPGNAVPVSEPGAPNTNKEIYSDDAFLQKIVNWIVADDQVLLLH
jgi:hypothetical protein